MPQNTPVTVNELKPGHLYQVVEVGDKPSRFLTAFVIGTDAPCPFRALTVRMPEVVGNRRFAGVGTSWGPEDVGARFVEHYGPLMLTPPKASAPIFA